MVQLDVSWPENKLPSQVGTMLNRVPVHVLCSPVDQQWWRHVLPLPCRPPSGLQVLLSTGTPREAVLVQILCIL